MKKKGAALITGAAKRIGREMAIFLAHNGYDIAISYNQSKKDAQELADEVVKKFRVKCKIYQCDLTNTEEALILSQKVATDFENWNMLINNASIFNKSRFIQETISNENFAEGEKPEEPLIEENPELSSNLALHVLSPLFLSQEFTKIIRKRGTINAHIINMVDKNIARYDTNYFYYLLTKKFLAEFTKMLAVEISPEVRVNAIAPGFILNSINEENPSAETEKLLNKIPLKSQGEIMNILQALGYFMQNNFVTGQILYVDGGASLNHAG